MKKALVILITLLVVCLVVIAAMAAYFVRMNGNEPQMPDTDSVEDSTNGTTDSHEGTTNPSTDKPTTDENHVHDYTHHGSHRDATQTEPGEVRNYCVCGQYTTTITEVGHVHDYNYNRDVVAKKATCTEAGEVRNYCVCGAYSFRVVEDGHIRVEDEMVYPTCTSTGLGRGYHCSICNTVLVPQEVLEIRPHNYKKTVISPTCTERGYTLYECKNCEASYTDSETEVKEHILNKDAVCSICKGDFSIDVSSRIQTSSATWTINTKAYNRVTVQWQGKNSSGKTIKYITVQLNYYNAVNDCIYANSYRQTGPISSGQTINMEMSVSEKTFGFWSAIKGETISKVELGRITIEYDDGSIEIGHYNLAAKKAS